MDLSKSAYEGMQKLAEAKKRGGWSELSEKEMLEWMMEHQHDTEEIINHIKRKTKTKYLDGEITEQEYVSTMSQLTAEDDLVEDVEDMKAEKYQDLQEQFENDEISDEELEERMDRLFESGDDFLDADANASPTVSERATSVGSKVRGKLAYYALPICVLAPIVAVLLVPGISPMMAVVAAGPLLFLGLLLYGAYWARSNL